MAKANVLTAARLREVLNYNPDTGEFEWIGTPIHPDARGRVRSRGIGRGRNGKPGTVRVCRGRCVYHVIGIDGRQHHAHRLAWLWMMGKWPQYEIDHINRNGLDNRWCNLRDVTHKENNRNKKHKRISWNTRDKLWVVHYSFEKRSDAEAVVSMVENWLGAP